MPHFDFSHFTLGPIPAGENADLVAALVAYWSGTPDLVAISPALYYDEAPAGAGTPYAVLTVPPSKAISESTHGDKQLLAAWQFSVFSDDQDEAADLGATMKAALDLLHDSPPTFADGYLLAWDWSGQRLMRTAERGRAGETIWKQMHTYIVDVVHPGGV
jgi:hypothetical protein